MLLCLYIRIGNAAQAGSSAAGAIENRHTGGYFLFSEALSARVRRFCVSMVFTYSESLKPRYGHSTASSDIIRHTGTARAAAPIPGGRGHRGTGGRVPEGPRIFGSVFFRILSGLFLDVRFWQNLGPVPIVAIVVKVAKNQPHKVVRLIVVKLLFFVLHRRKFRILCFQSRGIYIVVFGIRRNHILLFILVSKVVFP